MWGRKRHPVISFLPPKHFFWRADRTLVVFFPSTLSLVGNLNKNRGESWLLPAHCSKCLKENTDGSTSQRVSRSTEYSVVYPTSSWWNQQLNGITELRPSSVQEMLLEISPNRFAKEQTKTYWPFNTGFWLELFNVLKHLKKRFNWGTTINTHFSPRTKKITPGVWEYHPKKASKPSSYAKSHALMIVENISRQIWPITSILHGFWALKPGASQSFHCQLSPKPSHPARCWSESERWLSDNWDLYS